VLENWTLRRIFGSKRDEVTGEWRKLHNEELIGVYCSPNIVRMTNSRRMRRGGECSAYGGGEPSTQFWWADLRVRDLWGDPSGRGRNNKMDLQEVGYWGMEWIGLAQDRDR